jgi:hypothetical protein
MPGSLQEPIHLSLALEHIHRYISCRYNKKLFLKVLSSEIDPAEIKLIRRPFDRLSLKREAGRIFGKICPLVPYPVRAIVQ